MALILLAVSLVLSVVFAVLGTILFVVRACMISKRPDSTSLKTAPKVLTVIGVLFGLPVALVLLYALAAVLSLL